MTERNDIERKIKKAYKAVTPDVLDTVLRDCDQTKGRTIMITETRKVSWTKRAVAVAAAVAIIITGALGISIYNNNSVISTVSLDVNPSIEIEVNKNEKVLAVNPLNDDGAKVIGEMDFKGSNIDVTVNALIGSMLREGYLNDLANSILISVDGNDTAKTEELQARLTKEIDNLLKTDTFTGSVLSQTVSHDTELEALAKQYGITVGKAQLIRQITSQNTRYTFEDLVNLSINELNLISASNGTNLENVTSTGSASDKKYIGAESAKECALSHANVHHEDVRGFECELDYERGTMVYEIEFNVNGYEYDYEINATDGSITSHHKEHDDDCRYEGCDHPSHSHSTHHSEGGQNTANDSATKSGDNQTTTAEYITRDEAKALVAKHAGVSESDVTAFECELDREDGLTVYEIEFRANGYEYDYEINAENGKVIKYSKEYDDDKPRNSETKNDGAKTDSEEFIGAEKAKQLALSHAGLSESDIRGLECEMDRADSLFEKDHYDVEFTSGGYEYEYEIDAVTGEVLKNKKERDD